MYHPADDSQGEPVPDYVSHQGSAVFLFEEVRVMPQSVRTAELNVDKTTAGVPVPNLCLPAQRNAMQV